MGPTKLIHTTNVLELWEWAWLQLPSHAAIYNALSIEQSGINMEPLLMPWGDDCVVRVKIN